jgi:hypothetical protein
MGPHDPRAFVGRQWLVNEVARFREDEDRRHLIIVGEPGSGKSAFIAYLAAAWNCPYHFIRVDSKDAVTGLSPQAFLISIGAQLAQRYGPEIFARMERSTTVYAGLTDGSAEVIGRTIGRLYTLPFLEDDARITVQSGVARGNARIIGEQVRELHNSALSLDVGTLLHVALLDPLAKLRAIAPRERVLILIDALDEASQHPHSNILDSIPRAEDSALPSNLRLLMTSRPGDHLAVFRDADQLRLDDSSRGYDQASRRDTRAYIEKRLGEPPLAGIAAALPAGEVQHFSDEVQKRSSGNFLYLFHLLNELAAEVGKGEPFASVPIPKNLDEIYKFFAVKRIRQGVSLDVWKKIYLPIIGILSVVREPIGRDLLARLAVVDIEDVDFVTAGLTQFLDVHTDESGRRFGIYHADFGEYLLDPKRNRDFPLEARSLHRRIADSLFTGVGRRNLAEPYALRHLANHLLAAGASTELHDLLVSGSTKIEWAEAHYLHSGSYLGYLDDLALAANAALAEPNGLLRVVRYTLIESSIRAVAANLSVPLLLLLGKTSYWSWPQLLEHVRVGQWQALTSLIPLVPLVHLDAVLSAVSQLTDDQTRAHALQALLNPGRWLWTVENVEAVSESALGIKNAGLRARVLANLAAVAPAGDSRTAMTRRALEGAASNLSDWRDVISNLPVGFINEAFAIAQTIQNEFNRAGGLGELLPLGATPSVILGELLAIKSPWPRAEGLARFLEHVPIEQRGWLPYRGLWLCRKFSNSYDHVRAVSKFLPFVPPRIRKFLTMRAVREAQQIASPADRWVALRMLVQHVPAADQQKVIVYALDTIGLLADPQARFRGTLALLEQTPAESRIEVAAKAFERLDELAGTYDRHSSLYQLAALVPEAMLGKVLERVGRQEGNWSQQDAALAVIAPRLKGNLLEEAKAIVLGIPDELQRSRMLASLARHPSMECRRWIIETVGKLSSEHWRADALVAIASKLPELRSEILEAARDILDAYPRAKALVALLNLMPETERRALIPEALRAAKAIPYTNTRAERMAEIGLHLEGNEALALATEAIQTSREVGGYSAALQHLSSFFERLDGATQSDLVADLLSLLEGLDDRDAGRFVRGVAAALSAECDETAQRHVLTTISRLPGAERGWALKELAGCIREELVDAVYQIACDLPNEFDRTQLLSRISIKLSGAHRVDAIERVKAFALKSEGKYFTAAALTHLPEEAIGDEDESLWRCLLGAANDSNETARAGVANEVFESMWIYVVRRVPSRMLPCVTNGAKAMANPRLRALVCCQLAGRFTGDTQGALVAEGLAMLRPRINDATVQMLLIELCESAPPNCSRQFLEAAQNIADEYQRTKTLVGLAAKYPRDVEVIRAVFKSVVALSNDGHRAMAINDMAPLLSDETLDAAFDQAKAMRVDGTKAVIYSALGVHGLKEPRMPSVSRILDVARSLSNDGWRRTILLNLALIEGEHQVGRIREALISCGGKNQWERTPAYERLLAEWKRIGYVEGSLSGQRILAECIRATKDTRLPLLESLGPLAPALAHFGGAEAIRSLFESTKAVFRSWP